MFQIKEERILENKKITSDIYLMKLEGKYEVKAGQFFMLKVKNADMVLYRPISIFDADSESISFLYSVRGKGTRIFADLRQDDKILVHGPYGNGFPVVEGNLLLLGGGIGMAPLHLVGKDRTKTRLVVGLREGLYNDQELANIKELFTHIEVDFIIGGFVTDQVDYGAYDAIFACGPEIMMEIASKKHPNTYVSLERHMGCGIGACLSCSCQVDGGMKRVCKDGPVFLAKEVF